MDMDKSQIVLTIPNTPNDYDIRIDEVSVDEHEQHNEYVFCAGPIYSGWMKMLVLDLLNGGNILRDPLAFEVRKPNTLILMYRNPLLAEADRRRLAEWIRRQIG